MGKRNKESEHNSHVKTKKKRAAKDTLVNDDITEETPTATESTGNGKNKKIVFENDKPSKSTRVKNNTEKHNASSHNRFESNSTISNEKYAKNKTKQNKKIIFTDDNDEGVEVATKTPRSNKNVRLKESADDEPADEEIDKFCDELDEEDNVQYDNWVKLIETKLCPNKKK